jgi:hypothetical protein
LGEQLGRGVFCCQESNSAVKPSVPMVLSKLEMLSLSALHFWSVLATVSQIPIPTHLDSRMRLKCAAVIASRQTWLDSQAQFTIDFGE